MMNHKLKTLAVAVMLAASAGQANAALMTIDNGSGSELFLSVYDPTSSKSYIRDLGINFYDFLRTGATAATPGAMPTNQNTPVSIGSGNVTSSGYNLSFAADSLLTSWMGSTLSSNAIWMVGAGDSSGVQPHFITTFGSGNINIVGNGNLNSFSNADIYLYGYNSLTANGSTFGTSLNGSGAATAADGPDVNFPTGMGSNWANSVTAFSSTAKVGQSMSFYDLIGNAGSNATATQYTNSAGAAMWKLAANGTLTYAAPTVSAVPVPAAVWLFGSGLLGLVGVSRRKKV